MEQPTNNNILYGNCKFCNAKNVRNPKTGKIFCSEKCWLKNKPDEFGVVGAKPKSLEVEQSIRENMKIKSEGQAKGAAFNKAVDVAIATYQKGDVKFGDLKEEIALWFEYLKGLNSNGKED